MTPTSTTEHSSTGGFHGAKLFLFIGSHLVVIRRDDIPTIPWPNMLDVPGGAREGDESADTCVLRETSEELGLTLGPEQLIWRAEFEQGVYFAAHLQAGSDQDIVFGDEGQGWQLMTVTDYLGHVEVIPHHTRILRDYLGSGEAASKRL